MKMKIRFINKLISQNRKKKIFEIIIPAIKPCTINSKCKYKFKNKCFSFFFNDYYSENCKCVQFEIRLNATKQIQRL